MHLVQRRILPRLQKAAAFQALIAAITLLAFLPTEQSACGQATAPSTTPPAGGLSSQTPFYQAGVGSTVGSAGEATAPWPGTPIPNSPLAWYPFQFYPHLTYQVTYGNGLQSSPGHSEKTVMQTVSPGLHVRWRDIWSLDYTPSFVFYSSRQFRDTVNHSLSLEGATTYQAWRFSLSQTYVRSDEALVETASQTEEQTIGTALGARYQLNSKVALNFGVSQTITLASQSATNSVVSDSTTWAANQGVEYQFIPQLTGTLTLSESYDSVQHGNNMTSEQLTAGFNWQVEERLTLSASAGAQVRQYTSGGASDTVDPIFTASARYQLFAETSLFITGERTQTPSLVSGQASTVTSVSCGLSQRLIGRFQLVLDGGYSHTEYDSTASGSSVRNDDTTSFSANLSRSFLTRGTASVFYSYSHNSSSIAGFGYSSNQIGLSLGYRY